MNETHDPDEPYFDPDELEAIALAMDQIMDDEAHGYEMIFWISRSAAHELLEAYDRYKKGSVHDAMRVMYEFHKIVEQLRYAVESDNEED